MDNMIYPDGSMSVEFRELVSGTVDYWRKSIQEPDIKKPEFIVVGVKELPRTEDDPGRVSYWGIVDVVNTPLEDLYIEIERRFYCAFRTVGQHVITDLRLDTLGAVQQRLY